MSATPPEDTRRFRAPWSPGLMATTLFVCLICLAVFGLMLPGMVSNGPATGAFWVGLLPLAIPLVSSLFTIRGYRVDGSSLLVGRLLWETCIPLEGLSAVDILPQAMQGGSKTLANSGLFAYCGRFFNARLGAYRALVTDRLRGAH